MSINTSLLIFSFAYPCGTAEPAPLGLNTLIDEFAKAPGPVPPPCEFPVEDYATLSSSEFTVGVTYPDTGFVEFPSYGELKLFVKNRTGEPDEEVIPYLINSKTATLGSYSLDSGNLSGEIRLSASIDDKIISGGALEKTSVEYGPFSIASPPLAPSLITNYDDSYFTVFSGKIDHSIWVADEVAKFLKQTFTL